MTHLAPLDLSDIRDPELLELIDQCRRSGVPDALFAQILARVPNYAKVTLRALLQSHYAGSVDHKLKEIIRIQLARFAEDTYFAGLRSAPARQDGLDEATIDAGAGDYDEDPRFTEAEKIALRFADQMYLDASKLDTAFYDKMKRHYTEAQIMELGAFIALHYGMQVFMRTLGASPGVMPR
jgi:alkylhydroperoxidase family enzyme